MVSSEQPYTRSSQQYHWILRQGMMSAMGTGRPRPPIGFTTSFAHHFGPEATGAGTAGSHSIFVGDSSSRFERGVNISTTSTPSYVPSSPRFLAEEDALSLDTYPTVYGMMNNAMSDRNTNDAVANTPFQQ
jgi:hypothetical protein